MCVQRLDDSQFCNSHYVSHFAAFFIVVRAKISVAESYKFSLQYIMWQFPAHNQVWLGLVGFFVVVCVKGMLSFIALSERITFAQGLGCGFGSRGNDPSAGSPTER